MRLHAHAQKVGRVRYAVYRVRAKQRLARLGHLLLMHRHCIGTARSGRREILRMRPSYSCIATRSLLQGEEDNIDDGEANRYELKKERPEYKCEVHKLNDLL